MTTSSPANLPSDDWKLVVSFAHYSGENRSLLTDLEARELRLLADGFGDLRNCSHSGRNEMLWDWSHVRDSSEEAVARMAEYIRSLRSAPAPCSTCGGSGTVRPHRLALLYVNCPTCSVGR